MPYPDDDDAVMSIGELKENIILVTELGTRALGGGRLRMEHKVLVCVHDHYFLLERVAITCVGGSFVLVLGSDTPLPLLV